MIKSQIKTALGRIALSTGLGTFPVRVRKGPAKGARWTLAPFSHYWREGALEPDVPAAFGYFDSLDGLVFWDIGAHYGIHSVGAAMQVGPHGQVVSFEPDPIAFSRLKKHAEWNNLANIKLMNVAASDTNGRADLYTPNGAGQSVSHLKFYAENDMTGTPSVAVPTVAIDGLVDRGEIRLPQVIKVDAQGHGGKALAGASKAIATAQPVIAFSNHSHAELEQTREVLEPLGYRAFDFEGGAIPWAKVEEAILAPAGRRSIRRQGRAV